MNKESREPRTVDGPRLERAIILQLLRDDHAPRWSREELMEELRSEAGPLEEALIRLDGEGVLGLSEDGAWASRAARRLDQLELIGI
jgi:hypothetical protein